jgi:hypothetical protein
LKEHGRKSNRDQLPFELLRESSQSRRGIDQFALRRAERDPNPPRRQVPLIEDEGSRVGRFVGRVKGLATKGKDAVSSKYQSSKMAFGRKKKEDDVVELLAAGSSGSDSSTQRSVTGISTRPSSNGATGTTSTGGSGGTYRGTASRDPPKDIFDDI